MKGISRSSRSQERPFFSERGSIRRSPFVTMPIFPAPLNDIDQWWNMRYAALPWLINTNCVWSALWWAFRKKLVLSGACYMLQYVWWNVNLPFLLIAYACLTFCDDLCFYYQHLHRINKRNKQLLRSPSRDNITQEYGNHQVFSTTILAIPVGYFEGYTSTNLEMVVYKLDVLTIISCLLFGG